MKKLYINSEKNNAVKNPPLEIEVADNFFTRFRGLMLRKSLPENQGLLISPCNSVHMCWMRFAIDIVYIDRNYKVLKIVENLRPWIGTSVCFKAWGVIEMNAGVVKKYGIKIGDILNI